MRKSEKPYVFESIHDIPIFCWFNLLSTKNLAYLKKSSLNTLEEVTQDESKPLMDLYYKLFDEYNEAFGVSEQAGKLKDLKVKLLKAQNNYLQKQKRYLLNKINFCEYELEKYSQTQQEGPTNWEAIPILEEHYHFEMEPKTTSIFSFYSRMKSRNTSIKSKQTTNV